MKDLHIAVACSSNMNRSMEAHAYLAKKGFRVKSYGCGDKVRLPGESPGHPNCYDFGTPYSEIYQDLVKKDPQFYKHNGLLNLLNRNKRIKLCPERLQDSTEVFDVIVTCEERIFDQVIDWFDERPPVLQKKVQIVNLDIEDNLEDATIGSFLIADMVTVLSRSEDLEEDMDKLHKIIESKIGKAILYCSRTY